MTSGLMSNNTRKWHYVTTLLVLMLVMPVMAQNLSSRNKYRNPIISEDAADPTIVKCYDDYYYLFA